jgi:hypothetical protein
MRWYVKALDRRTGQDASCHIEAPDERAAREKAYERGIVIESIFVDDVPEKPVRVSYAPPSGPYLPEYTGIVIGAIILRALAAISVILGFAVGAWNIRESIGATPAIARALLMSGVLYMVYSLAAGGILYMLAHVALAIRDMARNSFEK